MKEIKKEIKEAKKLAELSKKLETEKRDLETKKKMLNKRIETGKDPSIKAIEVKYKADRVSKIQKKIDKLD